ncbi:MAG: ECF transporter S component [Ruminococcus sp.]|nr:ECF transporter S component [Ruminococcus sp.]MCM1382191.1 ECF transporter S component [Muribaculaceae bacterium]MCM1479887.1 ECF transporter S component [Muribaculaceae bacterium]
MKSVAEKRKIIYKIVTTGLMAALVYAGNWLSIPLPNDARVHLGNAPCLLAGLLFGGLTGGLAAGIGGAMYDLFNPLYITSAPITFINKFLMGWTAGFLNRRKFGNEYARTVIAAAAGQIVYIILYLGKTLISQLIAGNAFGTAMVIVGEKAVSSAVNGVLAVIISVPLYFAIRAALAKTPIGKYMLAGNNGNTETNQ